MMNHRIGWLQPEHQGPAFDTWKTIQEGHAKATSGTAIQAVDFIPLTPFRKDDDGVSEMNRKNTAKNNENTTGATENVPVTATCGKTAENGTPWVSKDKYSADVVGLHQEVCDFYEFMKCRPDEHKMREDAVSRVQQVVENLWPTAQVKAFGSFRTGLYLPTSDIDLVVFGKWERLPLWTLGKALLANNVAESHTIKVLDKASVPIVKLTDQETNLKIDISFNIEAGLKAAEFVWENVRIFPYLPPLVFILKQFLVLRGLNEVFTGGIGSYSLVLMVISFLQHHPRREGRSSGTNNLGVLLIEFFELYGITFNYANTGISVKNGGSYFNKQEVLDQAVNAPFLCIEDPCTPGNYLGKSSYAFLNVREAFKFAFHVLSKAVSKGTGKREDSLLERIVRASRTVEPERQGGDEDHVPSTTVTVAPLLRVPTYASVANKHIQPKPHRSDVSKSTAVRLPPSGANSVQMNSGCEDDCDNTELGGRQHRTESAQYRNSLTASVTRGSGSSGKRDAKSYKGAVKDDSRAERVTATSSKKPPKGTKTSWSSAVDKHVGSGPLSNENPHVIPDAEVVFMDANSSGSRTQPAVANARNKDWQTPSKRKKARHASDHS